MTKILAVLALLGMTFGVSVFSLVVGWGLSPHNWFAIGGSWIALFAVQTLFAAIK